MLTYWTGWNGIDLDKQTKDTIDPFNKSHDTIQVQIQTVFGQYQKVLTAIAAGTPPDVVSAVWLSQLSAMAVRDALLPLDDYFKSSNLKPDDFFPNYWEQWHYGGKLWGLAITTSSSLYCYNESIVRESKLDPASPPKTTNDLDVWAEKMTVVESNGNLKRIGFRPAGLWLWGHVFGANFYDENTKKITANEPKMIEALDWIASYGKKWDITKIDSFESGFGSYAGATNPFLVGLQASLITGEWMIEYAKAFKADLEPNIKMVAPPAPKGGRENVTTFGGSIFTVPKGVAHPDASWEFIRFIQDPKIGGTFARDIANLQPVKATLSDPRFTGDPRIKLGLDLQAGKNAFGVLPIPVHELYMNELDKAQNFVLHKQKSTKEALDDVTAYVQSELDLALKGAGH